MSSKSSGARKRRGRAGSGPSRGPPGDSASVAPIFIDSSEAGGAKSHHRAAYGAAALMVTASTVIGVFVIRSQENWAFYISWVTLCLWMLASSLFVMESPKRARLLSRSRRLKWAAIVGQIIFSFGLCSFTDRYFRDETFHSQIVTLNLPSFSDNATFKSEGQSFMESLRARLLPGFKSSSDAATGDGFVREFSIVIAARDEDEYLSKTVQYIVDNTPESVVREIIIVDDASANPQADILAKELSAHYARFVKVIRFDKKEGLIRARIAGADASSASNIFFLDGHCRPFPGWEAPLLDSLSQNPRRLVCPVIEDIHRSNWTQKGTHGTKMMFSWNFEFNWFEDLTDEIPVSAGGILGITRSWWVEGGKYDPGMLEWGGENLEQSMRTWLCGGEIRVLDESRVGHIFDRPPKPNPGNSLVRQVQTNQKRAALVWLDDYYSIFEQAHPVVKELDPGFGLEERLALRKRLNCKPFEWYIRRFRAAFERKGMLWGHFHNLMDVKTRLCLSALADDSHELQMTVCDNVDQKQHWQPVAGGRLLYNRHHTKCLDMTGGFAEDAPVKLYSCDWLGVFKGTNRNQLWATGNGTIFHPLDREAETLDGNDDWELEEESQTSSQSFCLVPDYSATSDGGSSELIVVRCHTPLAKSTRWEWLW